MNTTATENHQDEVEAVVEHTLEADLTAAAVERAKTAATIRASVERADWRV